MSEETRDIIVIAIVFVIIFWLCGPFGLLALRID